MSVLRTEKLNNYYFKILFNFSAVRPIKNQKRIMTHLQTNGCIVNYFLLRTSLRS
jgi:hypothetical protein